MHFEDFRPPDILNAPISSTILQLKSIGIKNVQKFPFPTQPDSISLDEALSVLFTLGSLRQCRKGTGDIYEITDLGRKMAALPIAPRYSKMLVLAEKYNLSDLMCIIVAALEVENIFRFDIEGNTAKESTGKSKALHAK